MEEETGGLLRVLTSRWYKMSFKVLLVGHIRGNHATYSPLSCRALHIGLKTPIHDYVHYVVDNIIIKYDSSNDYTHEFDIICKSSIFMVTEL